MSGAGRGQEFIIKKNRHRPVRRALTTAFIAVITLVGTGVLTGVSLASTAVTFPLRAVDVANPGRGFYRYTETHLTGDPSSYQRLSASRLAAQRITDGTTLHFRYFYLDGYRNRDRIDPRDLGLVRADLSAARTAGVKLIVRFAYSSSSGADAPPERVRSHIQQLAPVLNDNAAVIAAIQAGFIGRWGEWFYSNNFTSNPSLPGVLTDRDWQVRGSVLYQLLDSTAASIPVQVRYPAIKQRLLSNPGDARAARVGVHNDCFLAGSDDYGTFTGEADRQWLAAQSRSVLIGGETCTVNPPRTDWRNASAEMARYRYTYLNADYDRSVLALWGSGGLAETKRRLGYRLRLLEVVAPDRLPQGATGTVRIRLINDGWAAPLTDRPVQLVLKKKNFRAKFVVPADLRTWTPGTAITLIAPFTTPDRPGALRFFLNLPDPAKSLASSLPLVTGEATNAAYAIRFANEGTWDAKHGWNSLASEVTVTE